MNMPGMTTMTGSMMGNSTMDMGGSTMKMGNMDKMLCMKHQMWTYFHVTPDDTILFDSWGVSNVGEMVWSSAIIFALAILPELIKLLRWKLERRQNLDGLPYIRRLFALTHMLQTLLFCVQLCFSYVLMLCFMTFNVWLCIAVVAGMTVGYLAFGSRQERKDASSHF